MHGMDGFEKQILNLTDYTRVEYNGGDTMFLTWRFSDNNLITKAILSDA